MSYKKINTGELISDDSWNKLIMSGDPAKQLEYHPSTEKATHIIDEAIHGFPLIKMDDTGTDIISDHLANMISRMIGHVPI